MRRKLLFSFSLLGPRLEYPSGNRWLFPKDIQFYEDEGEIDGLTDGLLEGDADVEAEGLLDELADGEVEGDLDGEAEGLAELEADGLVDGEAEGLVEGLVEGD